MANINDELSGYNGYYHSLGPVYEPGYRFLFRPIYATQQPTQAPAYSDPRGVMPDGTVPASRISYQIVDVPTEIATPTVNVGQVAFVGTVTLGLTFGVADVLLHPQSTIALVVFEGHDVIDLPISSLAPGPGDGLKLPSKVFLPIWAGASLQQKMKDEKTDIATVAALEHIHRSPDNGIQGTGVVASIDPPMDCLTSENGVFPKNLLPLVVDTASDTVKASGEFISYVAVDKPLFRDVVSMTNGINIQGTLTNAAKINVMTAGPNGLGRVQILRYAFVNTETPENPIYQWRLAESYGVIPAKVLDTLPPLEGQDKINQVADQKILHYAYNLLDKGPELDPKANPPKPIKTAYPPAMARAKADKTSIYYDETFQGQLLPVVGQLFNPTGSEVKSIYADDSGTGIVATQRSFVSPSFGITLGANTRVGVEYSLFNERGIISGVPSTTLVSTKPAAPSPAACYDAGIGRIILFSVEEGTASERQFNDSGWDLSPTTPPDSKLKSFLIGEPPYRSEGWAAIHPVPKLLPNAIPESGTEGTVTIGTTTAVTSALFSVQPYTDPATAPVFQMFTQTTPSDTVDPIFESSLVSQTGGQQVPIPSIFARSFRIKNSGGSVITSMDGVDTASYLPDLSGAVGALPDNTSAITLAQIQQIKAQDFPLNAESVGAAHMSNGSYMLAYLNQGRIDMAYRSSTTGPFRVVRDVCMRVPVDLNVQSAKFPAVSNPFMLPDDASETALLFYGYKNRLVVKNIPTCLFSQTDPTVEGTQDNNIYDSTTEMNLIASMQALAPTVVYDGHIADRTKLIAPDLQLKAIVLDTNEAAGTGQDANILTYAAVITSGNGVFAFIQDGSKIVVRKSPDSGLVSWADAVTDYVFLPKLPDEPQASRAEGQFPFVFYYEPSDKIYFFMFYQNALLQMNMPASVFDQDPEEAASSLDELGCELIYGTITDEMKQRGIVTQASVEERMESADFSESMSPQRLAIAATEVGHFRLFYRDNNGRLATLISTDTGINWQTQDQYLEHSK